MATALQSTFKKKKPSVLKRIRQTERRAAVNRANRSRLRTQLRKFREALSGGKIEEAGALLKPTLSLIDKMIQKGILHKNTAGRQKSRLTKRYNSAKK